MLQKIHSILLKDSLKQVGAYTITGALCKAISFAALPFFVNTLSEGDIGILNIFSNCIVFFTPIISMGVLYTISIDYFKLPRDKYATVLSTGLIIPAVLSLLLIPVLYIFREPLEKSFHFQYSFFWLVPVCLFLNFCFEAFIILIRNENKVKLFTAVSLLKVVVEISLSVLFVLFIYENWYSRAFAFLLAGMAVAGFFFYYISKHKFLVRSISYPALKTELYFGLSGMILQTAIFFINSSDKFFVISYFGKEQAGLYAVASTFASIQYIICFSLLQYLQPVLYRKFADGMRWNNVKDLYYKYFGAMLLTLVGVIIFTFIVYHYILKPVYKENLEYFYVLSISSFVWSISNIFLQYIVFNKNKRIILQLSILGIFVALLVNFIASLYTDVLTLGAGQIITNLLVLIITLLYNRRLNYFTN